MKKSSLALLAATAVIAAAPARAAMQTETLVIVNARAVTLSAAGVVDNATLVIKDGQIVAVGANAAAPDGARVIDARGRFVTPGFMDSATQLGLVEVDAADDTVDYRTGDHSIGASFDVRYALNANSTLIPLARADGLTRAVVFPSGSGGAPFSGMSAILRLREGADILERSGVALFARVGGQTAAEVGGSRNAQWVLIRNALEEALHFKAHSKAYETASGRDQLLNRLDVKALQPLIERRVPLAIFASRESDIRQAMALADDYKLSIVLCGATEAWRVAELLAARKIPVVLNPADNMPVNFDEIGARLDNAAILQRAGVLVSFYVSGVNASHNVGAAIREAAGLAVANGLKWEDALRALTINPARTWGVAERYGTIEVGRDADIIVWSADPLEPMSAAEVVIVAGKQVSLATRQTELRDRYGPGRRGSSMPPAYRSKSAAQR